LKNLEGQFAIGPAFWALGLLAVPLSPGIVLGILTWIYRDGEVAGSLLFAGALWIWLSVATQRVAVSGGVLSMRRFGIRRWEIDVARATLQDGLAGDIPILPAIVVTDKKTRHRIGYLLKAQFRASDIQTLRDVVSSQ
jgi:hypothetical protein